MSCAHVKVQLEKLHKIEDNVTTYQEACKKPGTEIKELLRARDALKKELHDFKMFFEEQAAEYVKLPLILAESDEILSGFQEGYMKIKSGETPLLISTEGEPFFPKGDVRSGYNIRELGNVSCGLVSIEFKDGVSWYIDTNGKKVIDGDAFAHMSDFIKPDNVAMVTVGLYQFIINTKGETISTHFQNIQGLYDGGVMIAKDGQYYLCDFSGKRITDETYTTADFQDEGGIYKVSCDGKTKFFIDSHGKQIGEKYTDIRGFSNGRGQVQIDNTWHFIDIDGKIVCGGYEDAKIFKNGRAFVKIKGKWSVIDTYGNVLFGGFDDDGVQVFKEGRAHVAKKGVHAIIDVQGNTIFEGNIKLSGMFNNGLCTLHNGINSYQIDINGKIKPLW